MSREKLLEVKNLRTHFKIGDDIAKAIDGLDFDIYEGEVLGIVGESGSGKSVTSLSMIQLIPNPPGEVADGEVYFKGEKIFDGKELNEVKAIPRYHFLGTLSERNRHLILIAAMIGWISLLLSQAFLAPLPGIISVIVLFAVLFYLLYNSPRNKQLKAFRERLFKRIRDIRGREIAMIFQEPMTSLNPVFTVGMQIIESIEGKNFREYLKDWIIHTAASLKSAKMSNRVKTSSVVGVLFLAFSQLLSGWTFAMGSMITWFIIGFLVPVFFTFVVIGLDLTIPASYRKKSEELFQKGVALLEAVGIPDPEKRLREYPHQFSGGMRQRAMIAMALAKNPSLLIADEPTTALDVTIQAQILELMLEVKSKREDAAVILITHDLAVVAETCDRVIVMYGGKIQEVAEINELFNNPMHPYTLGLLKSIPNPARGEKIKRLEAIPGIVPNILSFPPGCKFCTRCERKLDYCDTMEPELRELKPDHFVRCHLYNDDGSLKA